MANRDSVYVHAYDILSFKPEAVFLEPLLIVIVSLGSMGAQL